MRPLIFVLILGLAGCANPELEQLKTACAGGNLQACSAHESHRRANLDSLQQSFEAMSATQPVRQQTMCQWVGHVWTCT